MLARTLPFMLLCACASTAQLPTADQPELAELARPYAQQLQAVGITRVISPGSGAPVLLETGYGAVYIPYPAAVEPLAFVLDIGPEGLHGAATTFDRAKDLQMLAALLPEACGRRTPTIGWGTCAPIHGTDIVTEQVMSDSSAMTATVPIEKRDCERAS